MSQRFSGCGGAGAALLLGQTGGRCGPSDRIKRDARLLGGDGGDVVCRLCQRRGGLRHALDHDLQLFGLSDTGSGPGRADLADAGDQCQSGDAAAPQAAWDSAVRFRRFLIATLVMIVVSAQFVHAIPQSVFLMLLGLPIMTFALAQLSGRNLALRLEHRDRGEWVLGAIGGLYGGVSGVWGPPLIVYLLSIGAQKVETVRVQGVVFLLGAVVLLGAHLQTGLMTGQNLWFSAALVLPALLGQIIGLKVQDRLDQARFRRWTQALLVLTGANLVWRAVQLV